MPKKKGVGKRKVQETPEEKQMRLEMEELKVDFLNSAAMLFLCSQSSHFGWCQRISKNVFLIVSKNRISSQRLEDAKNREFLMKKKLIEKMEEEALYSR